MTKTPWIAGAALAALLGATGYAYAMPDGPPRTRTDVQARIADHFKKADGNGDGYVTKPEAEAARAAGRAERREKMFAMLDADKNGALSKEEFAAPRPHGEHGAAGKPDGHDGKHRGHRGWRMKRHGGMGMGMGWFDRADADKDGRVSLAEASARPLAMFDSIDTNRDGTLSAEEHEAARAAMRTKWRERRDGATKG